MNYLIDSRSYSALQPLELEHQYKLNKNYLFDLSYLSAISIEGEKAAEFLQGQISCDVRAVTEIQMQQGVMCNLKGRILAALDVVFTGHHQFTLVVPHDLSADTQALLAKPAMFSRVNIHASTFKLFGLYIQNDDDLMPLGISLPLTQYAVVRHENTWCYSLGGGYYLLLIQPESVEALRQPFMSAEQYRGSLAWHALQLQRLHVEIYPCSRGVFLPHRLDMHLTGYLNFDKGCYKGQEIIARMHYRSTQKHVLTCFNVQTDSELSVGMSLYDDELSIVGELVDYCPLDSNNFYIAVSVLKTYKGDFRSPSKNTIKITSSLLL